MQYNQRELARHAQRRYLKEKKTTEQYFDDIRTSTVDKLVLCIVMVLEKRTSKAKINDVTEWVDRYSAKYIFAQQHQGTKAANEELRKMSEEVMPKSFSLPCVFEIKRNRDWDILGAQRIAAEKIARLYTLAMQTALGYDAEKIENVLLEVAELYRKKFSEK